MLRLGMPFPTKMYTCRRSTRKSCAVPFHSSERGCSLPSQSPLFVVLVLPVFFPFFLHKGHVLRIFLSRSVSFFGGFFSISSPSAPSLVIPWQAIAICTLCRSQVSSRRILPPPPPLSRASRGKLDELGRSES